MEPDIIVQAPEYAKIIYYILAITLVTFSKVAVDIFKAAFSYVQKKKNGGVNEEQDSLKILKEEIRICRNTLEKLEEWHNVKDPDGTFTWHNKVSVEGKIERTSEQVASLKETVADVKGEVRTIATSNATVASRIEALSSEVSGSLRETSQMLNAIRRLLEG